MSQIRIVVDSTSDIPASIRKDLGIEMVPLKVHFGSETYLDSVTIQSGEFYDLLSRAKTLPTTSQPSPVDFVDMYKKLIEQEPDTDIISIHISSALSGTFQSATLAKSLLEGKADITIVDSKSASYGIGILAVRAVEAVRAGASKKEVLELMLRLRQEFSLYFLVDTLDYLQKGGRIGKAAAFLGSLLNIKPILTVDDGGEVNSVDKVRGQKKAMVRIVELLKEKHPVDQPMDVTMFHSMAQETAEEFFEMIQAAFQVGKIRYTALGPVIGTHVGPGTVAVLMLPV